MQTCQLARLLGVFAAEDRATKVFANPRQARRWIEQRSDEPASLESRAAVVIQADGQA